MNQTDLEPKFVPFSIFLYRMLLLIYPSEFRREYGEPMLQIFGDCCRKTLRQTGPVGMLQLYGRTLLDTVQTAIEQHTQRGVDMSKEKYIKVSGWALILAGMTIALGSLAGSRPEFNRFNALSLPIDQYANAAETPLFTLGLVLLSLGIGGLVARYGEAAGNFGRFSLGLGMISGLVSASGVIGLAIYDSESWWSLFFWGLTAQFLGLALFGVVCLQRRLLPRWNGLPLLAGVWVPLFVASSLIIEQFTGTGVDWQEWVFYSLWLLSLTGLAGLGLVLQSNITREERTLPAA